MSLRYVILRHEGVEEPHFDLMFETSPRSLLLTWRSAKWPPGAGDIVEQLPDHRRQYLTYEGKLTGNRGQVRRVEAGTCEVHLLRQGLWQMDLRHPTPPRPPLALRFEQRADGRWVATSGA